MFVQSEIIQENTMNNLKEIQVKGILIAVENIEEYPSTITIELRSDGEYLKDITILDFKKKKYYSVKGMYGPSLEHEIITSVLSDLYARNLLLPA